jgi:hypothetical protein
MESIRIEGTTEMMFAQAVALSQAGRLRSTIHCGGETVYVLNMDNTILLNFKSTQAFPETFSFFANDYESPKIRVDKGQIVFVTNSNGIKRTKTCALPKTNFKEVEGIWKGFKPNKKHGIRLVKPMCSLLDDSLSHIELSKEKDGAVKLIQRDIYSGTRIEVQSNSGASGLFDENDDIPAFEPIGIRTVDFNALFSFTDNLQFYIQEKKPWIYFDTNNGVMTGILSTCIYDELGTIEKIKE